MFDHAIQGSFLCKVVRDRDDEAEKDLRLIANFGLRPLFQRAKNTQENHILPQHLGIDHMRRRKLFIPLNWTSAIYNFQLVVM